MGKYILTGYRPEGGTYKSNLKTLFTWHNETLNVWSMATLSVAALIMLAWVINVLKPPPLVLIPFITFALAPFIHIPFSTGYHLFIPISESVKRKWLDLDIAFIFIGISLVIFSLGYFVFDKVILTLVTATAILCSALVIFKKVKSKCKNTQLDKTKQTLAVAGIVTLLLAPIAYRANEPVPCMCLVGIVVSLIVGGILYAYQLPERIWPYTFDFVGSSHQIMHVSVLIAYIFEYIFLEYAFYTRFLNRI